MKKMIKNIRVVCVFLIIHLKFLCFCVRLQASIARCRLTPDINTNPLALPGVTTRARNDIGHFLWKFSLIKFIDVRETSTSCLNTRHK